MMFYSCHNFPTPFFYFLLIVSYILDQNVEHRQRILIHSHSTSVSLSHAYTCNCAGKKEPHIKDLPPCFILIKTLLDFFRFYPDVFLESNLFLHCDMKYYLVNVPTISLHFFTLWDNSPGNSMQNHSKCMIKHLQPNIFSLYFF